MELPNKNVPHVLLVEDEPDHRLVAEDRLRGMRVPFLVGEDFAQAQKILDAGQKIALVLTDGSYSGDSDFPNMGSMSLLRHMHRNGMTGNTPVILMTNGPDLVRLEMQELLAKPEMGGFVAPEVVLKTNMDAVFAAVSRKLGLPIDPQRHAVLAGVASRPRRMCLGDL